MHLPNIIDHLTVCALRRRYRNLVIFPVKVFEKRRAIIPTATCHVSMSTVMIYNVPVPLDRNLRQLVNMRCCIYFSLKCRLAHSTPIASVVVAQFPCRGRSQDQFVAIRADKLNVLSTADFPVNIVFQLFAPTLRVISKNDLSVGADIFFAIGSLFNARPAIYFAWRRTRAFLRNGFALHLDMRKKKRCRIADLTVGENVHIAEAVANHLFPNFLRRHFGAGISVCIRRAEGVDLTAGKGLIDARAYLVQIDFALCDHIMSGLMPHDLVRRKFRMIRTDKYAVT